MNMALCTAVKEGDLVKTRAILEDKTGDAKLVMLHIVDPDGKTTLHIASEEGHIDLVRYIVDLGADLEKRSRSGDAPLHFASRSGHQNVAQYLITKGAYINIDDSNGYTPLYLASEEGHFEVVRCLLKSGADINKASYDHSTPLYTSASKGNVDVVKYLITKGADLKQKGPKSQTPLCVASLNGHLEVVKYLISQRAELDSVDKDGYTPLYTASQEGHIFMVECLVDAGADVNQLIQDDDSPLHAASRNGHLDVVKYLFTKGAEIDRDGTDGYTPLFLASLEGHLNVVKFLVDAGADVNQLISDDASPLHAVSLNGHPDVVKYLITKGAEIEIDDNDGYTPLLFASKEGHLNVVKCLVDAGADINRASHNGYTPLSTALINRHHGIVEFLMTKEGDIGNIDDVGPVALCKASSQGYLDAVRYIITKGVKLNLKDRDGFTPLYHASKNGQLEVVECLVNAGADVNIAAKSGSTPLYKASSKGHLDIVKYLMNKGAGINMIGYHSKTPLRAASFYGHLEVVEYLISQKADKDMGDIYGYTPLYVASQEGHLDVAKCLVHAGADVNIAAKSGSTPLYKASSKGHLDIVKYLSSKGSNPNYSNNNGYTPLYVASQEGHLDVVNCLVHAGADVNKAAENGSTPLFAASSEGDLDIVRYLVSQGAKPNYVDDNGYAPLYVVSHKGHRDVAKCLVNAGADVNKAANNGSTPLYAASIEGHLDIVEYLMNKGADIDRMGYHGQTPLFVASFYGQLAVVKYLISQRADKDMCDNDGSTPLYVASRKCHLDIVQYLVSQGANPNSVDNKGYTPLCVASQESHLDVAKCLVLAGADVNKATNNGDTPLDMASQNGYLDIVQYLISQGANPNSVDNEGYTPLRSASNEGYLEVVECLLNAGADVNKPASDGDLSLLAASRGGYLDIIKYLITKGAQIESRNKDGWTVFHFAADNGHLESLEYFLRNKTGGTSGNSHNDLTMGLQTLKGVTPLMVAARGGHLDCVRLLLENNADIETEDAEGWTALHYAAASGNDSLMRDLLDWKAIMSSRLSRRGQSPISIALNSGNADIARILLDKDVSSILHIDSAGLTPIHIATVSGLTSIIEKLISLGVGVNPRSHDCQTPLHAAIRLCHCTKRQVEVTTALKQIQQESDDDISPAEALIQFLINQGSKIDIKDNNGFTPFQYARDERIRQMVFRSLSEDDIHTFRDLPIARSTESHRSIGCEGGVLHLDRCDVTMSIPPGTVQAGTCHDVSISLVTDDPPPTRESEFLTGHGIGITFPAQWRYSTNQPITLSLPHAATLLESDDGPADIIWKQTESTSVNRDESSYFSDTQCFIEEREIDFDIEAGAIIKGKVQIWIPIKLHYHALGKRMACTSFLPVDMAHGQDILLRIYIHEDIPYIVQNIQEGEENLLYRQVHPGRCFALEPESGDLELECNGRKEIISATELFNRQKTLVSMPITTDTNARIQMMNISITATSTNQQKASMAFMAIRTGFSTDIHSTLNAMVPGSNTDISNAEEVPSLDFITKEMNTDQYYHLGLALGMSYQKLDTIQFKSRQHEEAGVYTPNQKAAIFMIRYWKCLHHSVSIADDNLREVWKSVTGSGHSIPVSEQGRRAERKSDKNVEDIFGGEFHLKESRTAPRVVLHAYEVEIPEARGHWAESVCHKRSKTPSVRSDSLISVSTLLKEEEEGCFPKRYGAHTTGSARAHNRTFSTARHIRHRVRTVLSIDEHHEDEEKERSKQAIFAWMESGEGVQPADFRPHEDTSKPTEDEGQKIEPVYRIPSPSALQDDIPVRNLESRDDLSEGTDVIRLEKYGIEVRIPPNEAYSAKDVTVEPILDIPTELVLKETEAIISIGLRMSPSNATFDIPVTVTMPHCGIFTKPKDAKVVSYYRKSASESFTAIPSINGSPRCVVRHRDLDLYMDHFSEIWIVAIITRAFIGKRVICTPYIPVLTPKNNEHVVFVRVRDKHIGKGEVPPNYIAPILGEQFLVRWRSGGLMITCKVGTNERGEAKTLQESAMRHLTEQKAMFSVDTRNTDRNKVILHFILEQSTTKELLVPMHLEGNIKGAKVPSAEDSLLGNRVSASPKPSASTSAAILLQDPSAAEVSSAEDPLLGDTVSASLEPSHSGPGRDQGAPKLNLDPSAAEVSSAEDPLLGDTVSAFLEPSASTSATVRLYDPSAAAREVSTTRSNDTILDGELDSLAAKVPHNKYHNLSSSLGIEYIEANNILIKHGRDCKPAMRECLSIWKNKTGGSFTELQKIFDGVHLRGVFMEAIHDEDMGPVLNRFAINPNQWKVCNLLSLMFIVAIGIAIVAIVAIRD